MKLTGTMSRAIWSNMDSTLLAVWLTIFLALPSALESFLNLRGRFLKWFDAYKKNPLDSSENFHYIYQPFSILPSNGSFPFLQSKSK